MISLSAEPAAGDRADVRLFVVRVGGEVDILTAPALSGLVLAAISRPRHLVVDLSDVTFMDSSGLAALVEIRNLVLQDDRSTLRLAGLTGNVRRLFEVTGLMSVFTVVSDAAAATAGTPDAGTPDAVKAPE